MEIKNNKQINKNAFNNFKVKKNEYSNIKHVIGVVSGKGGVGKSLVTSMLAVKMKREGYKTAILDADVTGPSIPKSFGVKGTVFGNEKGIIPAETKTGIEIISTNLILENETDPVIWRGPIVANTVKQFWSGVYWGDVDYMFVDMPPGTGEVPLTVFQSLPVDGIIIVTSPQELVGMIVEKAANMAYKMSIPILGIVENMSYFICPHCGEKSEIFGKSKVSEIAKKHEIKTVSKLPIDPEIAKFVDEGKLEDYEKIGLEEITEMLKRI